MATPLDPIFASGGEALIITLELQCDAWEAPIRLCDEYEDLVLGLETGEAVLFEGSGIDYSFPKVNASGHQTRNFAIDNVRGTAQKLVDEAIQDGERVRAIMRIYAGDELTEPAEKPLHFTVMSSSMASSAVQIEAGFFDMLSRRLQQHFYTADKFPGVMYLV